MERAIPRLGASDIECRVQSVFKRGDGAAAVLLVYKDARVDMRILDEVYGPGNWQRTHEVINGNLFCNIDIWDIEKKCWVRKQDVGVESNTEKEKGQASDAFKRAGFNVGIGRELYTAPFIYVPLDKGEYTEVQGKVKCNSSTRFRVKDIGYNGRGEVNKLTIVDKNQRVRFSFGDGAAVTQEPSPTPEKVAQPEGPCSGCGGPITPAERGYSAKKFGQELCRSCQAQFKAGA